MLVGWSSILLEALVFASKVFEPKQNFILQNVQIIASVDLDFLENEDKQSRSIGGNPGKDHQSFQIISTFYDRLVSNWRRDDHSAC